MKRLLAQIIFFLFAFPLKAASPLPPIPNETLFSQENENELILNQKKFTSDEPFDSEPKQRQQNVQRQEEAPSQIKIKKIRKEPRRKR